MFFSPEIISPVGLYALRYFGELWPLIFPGLGSAKLALPLCGSVVTLVNDKCGQIVYSPDNPNHSTTETTENTEENKLGNR